VKKVNENSPALRCFFGGQTAPSPAHCERSAQIICIGTIPWAEKENPCERPLAKKTTSQDSGKRQRSKTHSEGDFVDDVAPKPRTVKAKISDESEVYPDFELAEDSGNSDSEVEDEQKDPLDWPCRKEFAIMSQQVRIFKPHHSFTAFSFGEILHPAS